MHDKQHTSFFAQSLLKQLYAYMTTISRSGFFIVPIYLHFIKTICYSTFYSFTHLYGPKIPTEISLAFRNSAYTAA